MSIVLTPPAGVSRIAVIISTERGQFIELLKGYRDEIMPSETLYWSGTDSSGKLVRNGVYIISIFIDNVSYREAVIVSR